MRSGLLAGLMLLAVSLTAGPASGAAGKVLQIEGSTTVGPIAEAFAEYFMATQPDIRITVKKTGSGDGAAALVDDRCEIAAMSRFMKEKEFSQAVNNGVFPVAHVIAMDGVCVIVHPSNPVQALTTEQVRAIYAGEITHWSAVGGPDQRIVKISRDTSSGTYETFHNLLMHKAKLASDVEYANSNPQSHARVKTTRGAIGYVGLGFVDEHVRALEIDGVKPNRRTIASGAYPVSRPLFLFTNGYPELGLLVHAFCTFHLSERGQEIVDAKGFVPVTNY